MPTQALTMDEKMAELRARHGDQVGLSELQSVVQSMISSMRGEIQLVTLSLGSELRELIDFISSTKVEIAAIRPRALAEHDIPGATDELDAIVAHTERAAGAIMDCAEVVSRVAGELDGKAAEELNAVATRIFEASSFQDITGQRVTKVVKLLKHIEEKLSHLAQTVGETEQAAAPAAGRASGDADLLNGPALDGAGNNQDDIDALLASFD